MKRTHTCGELNKKELQREVTLAGWVHTRRDHGGLVFIDLRDRYGITQVVFDPSHNKEAHEKAQHLGREWVIQVTGHVRLRPKGMENTKIPTGEIEIITDHLDVLNQSETPPFEVDDRTVANEEMRLEYRYLDLRRPAMQQRFLIRHNAAQAAREYLTSQKFMEIETPMLVKTTPGGARVFKVPSRVHPGKFFALPESPQIYKQLLMVSGFDRYFQIARCFRDEDLRYDRQPEFTQIDIEASFVGPEDVYGFVEAVLAALWDEAGHAVARPFPRISWREAMERYGTDKPDLRYGFPIADWTGHVKPLGVPFFEQALQNGGRVRGLAVTGGGALSRKDMDQLADAAKHLGGSGLAWAKRQGDQVSGSVGKFFTAASLGALGVGDGDAALMAVGSDRVTSPVLDRVRREVIRRLAPAPAAAHGFCGVVDFPLFEPDAETGAPVFAHHPFTAPHPEDVARLDQDPFACRALHYDAVYNGNELGSGSIRITDATVQRKVFTQLGLTADQVDARFGFLLTALQAGAPPHGGFAIGFDRVAMLLAGAASLRDVIAFPKTTAAQALFESAPSPVDAADLRALHIEVKR